MSCQNCQKTKGVCKVCALLDNDLSIKEVQFCGACNVNICLDCEGKISRRLPAFLKAKAITLKERWNELIEFWKQ